MSFFETIIEILYPSVFFLSTIVSGGLISYAICKYNRVPFVNPKQKGELTKKINYMIDYLPNICGVYTFVYLSYSKYFLITERKTSWNSAPRIFIYILFLEFIFYCYHRAVHTSFLYKKLHAQHHLNVIVFPLDYIDLNFMENVIIILIKNLPLYFVRLNYSEYTCIYLLYTTGGFLTHSSFFTRFHMLHHRSFKSNFCYIFPIYDIAFGTYHGR